jgi:putative glycosyltransferase (TIGR04372 family)
LKIKQIIWKLLVERSAFHTAWSPRRSNTIISLALIVIAAPVAAVLKPAIAFRTRRKGKIKFYELRVYGEFAWLVDHLERLRNVVEKDSEKCVVFIVSTFRHKGLAHLYRKSLPSRILWSNNWTALAAQVLLLQSTDAIQRIFISPDRILTQPGNSNLQYPDTPIEATTKLESVRSSLLMRSGIRDARYVALAVFTSTEEEIRADSYLSKYHPRETDGRDLTCSIDWLKEAGLKVILLGFEDSGIARIPRRIPRLTDFSRVGGLAEVALASGCVYFWSDFVGAQWLREPFKRPALITNQDEAWFQKSHLLTKKFLGNLLCTPLRFQRKDGHLMTIQESLQYGSCFEGIARGEITRIRNSCDELREANAEMLQRIDGCWKDETEHRLLRERLNKIYEAFPRFFVPPIASSFLARHPYLLD